MERRRPRNFIMKSFHLKLTNKFKYMDLVSTFVILLTFGLIQSGEYRDKFLRKYFLWRSNNKTRVASVKRYLTTLRRPFLESWKLLCVFYSLECSVPSSMERIRVDTSTTSWLRFKIQVEQGEKRIQILLSRNFLWLVDDQK